MIAGSTPQVVLAAVVIIAVTHWLGGIAVFGSTLLALPALAWLMPVREARALLLVVGTIQAWQLVVHTYRDVDWRRLGRMVLWAGIGMPVGIAAVRCLPEKLLLVSLGVVLVGSGASQFRRSGAWRWPGWMLNGFLVVGGIVHGAFATGGALVVVSAQQMLVEKDTFRGTLNVFWVILNTVLVATLPLTDHHLGLASPLLALAVPVTLVVTWVANDTARRLSQDQFRKLVAVLLVLAGVVTIARSLWWHI